MQQLLKPVLNTFLNTTEVAVNSLISQNLVLATNTCNLLIVGDNCEIITRIHYFPSDRIELLKIKNTSTENENSQQAQNDGNDLISELLNVVVGKLRNSLRTKGIETLQGLPYATPGTQEIFNRISQHHYKRKFYNINLENIHLIFEVSFIGLEENIIDKLEDTSIIETVEFL